MVTSTGPPSTLKRRTSSVAGRSRPATSATIPSVRVKRASSNAQRCLEGGGVGSVSTHDRGGGRRGPYTVGTCARATDKAPEQRVTIEMRDAHPVDRAVRGNERGGARVADEPVVRDRRLPPVHVSWP